MKRKIIIQRGANDTLNFFLISQKSKRFIFSQKFSLSVYLFFRNGRSEREILEYSTWGENPRLDKTISRLPKGIDYLDKNVY